MNKQLIFLGELYRSLHFTGIDRIDDYCHESNKGVARNNDQYLRSTYSIVSHTIISFNFANNNALSNSDFFALPNH